MKTYLPVYSIIQKRQVLVKKNCVKYSLFSNYYLIIKVNSISGFKPVEFNLTNFTMEFTLTNVLRNMEF